MVRVSLPPAQLTPIPWGVGCTLSPSPGLGKSLPGRAGSLSCPLAPPPRTWPGTSPSALAKWAGSEPAPQPLAGRFSGEGPIVRVLGRISPLSGWELALGAGFYIPPRTEPRLQGGAAAAPRREVLVPLPGWHLGPWALPSHLSLLPRPCHLPKAACCPRSLCFCCLGQNARPIQLCSAGLSGTALYPHAPERHPHVRVLWLQQRQLRRVWDVHSSLEAFGYRPSCEPVGKSLLSGPLLPCWGGGGNEAQG